MSIDVSGMGTLSLNRVDVETVRGGYRGAGIPQSIGLAALNPDLVGSFTSVMEYNGATNTMTLDVPLGTIKVTGCDAVPSGATDLTNKQYVDDEVQRTGVRSPVTLACDTPITGVYSNGTSGVGASLISAGALGLIDGTTPVVGNRILLRGQINPWENGIYDVTSLTGGFLLTRSTDYNTPTKVVAGSFFPVLSGLDYGGKFFVQRVQGTITIGVSSLEFSLIDGPTASAYLGSNLPAGSLLVRDASNPTVVGLPPIAPDYEAVLVQRPLDTTYGMGWVNIFELLCFAFQYWYGSSVYIHFLTPTPPAGIPLTGASGTLIPLGNFFNDPGTQLELSTFSCPISGGVNSAGITFNDATFKDGTPYLFLVQFSISIRIGTAQAAPCHNAVVLVENYGLPSQLVYYSTAQAFSFTDTSYISLACCPLLVSVFKNATKTYNVCLVVGDTGTNPSMFLGSYCLTAQIAT